ncbi:prepilin peptidase [Salinibacterium hongtaonis]|uniref:prepilin peptidase n=1 Tax=Homoserinimonas hongtaonis TaxID=2079791 RepID=UPI001F53F14C|nr:A24 family peptidase [Salinibacterium hongtaonis]
MTDLLTPLIVVVGVLGLLIGSFLNVVVYRLPLRESIVSPGSRCPKCGHPVRWWDNLPVVSWLLLRGRCRDCQASISLRYPAVELLTGALFAATAWWAFSTDAVDGVAVLPFLVAVLYLAAISVALGLIDLDTHTLPNRIVGPAYIVAGALLATTSLMSGDIGALVRAAIGAAILFLAYLVMALARPGGMGLGDVKLAGVLGLYLGWLGWGSLAVGGFAAFLLGGLYSIALLALRKANRKSGIPFGPWMLGGAWVGIFAGQPVWDAYLSWVGLAG